MDITLPMPPSSNTAYPSNQNGRRHLSKSGREWKEYAAQVIALDIRGYTITPPICLDFSLYVPNARKCDATNYTKLPIDVFCSVVGIDDNWLVIPEVSVRVVGIDRANPRCVMRVLMIPTDRKDMFSDC